MDQVSGMYRYFHSSHNNARLLPQPERILDINDFRRFLRKIQENDFLEAATAARPTSSWTLHRVSNVTVYVFHIRDHPIGRVDFLPDRIRRSKAIISLHKNDAGRVYDDNLCFWRCLAYHFSKELKGTNMKDLDLVHVSFSIDKL